MMNLHYGLIHVGLPTMVDLAKDKLPNIKEDNMPTNFELCKEGDVAFADASEDTNEVAKTIEFYNLAEKNVVCGLHTIHGRDNKHKTVVGFKGYTFSSTVFHNQIRRIAQGTKIYSISTKNFSECYIGLPSKPEQTKIATLLRLIDERVATQNKIIEALKLLRDAISDAMFCSPKQSAPRKRIKGFYTDWQKVHLNDICSRVTRKNTNGRCYSVLTIAAQYGLVSQLEFFNKSVASENLEGYYLLQKGDFAYNKSYSSEYTCGAVKRLDRYEEGVLSPLYICFRPDPSKVDSDYLAYYFESKKWHREIMDISVEGARNHGLLNISVIDYFNTIHRIPNIEEQRAIAKVIKTIIHKMSSEQTILDCYVKQRTFLLQQMFI
ncbi:restriction endonuclease subunit S [Butyricimonas virosa]|uniref:restriction endonuclease subunit S n=1 Tax=Butyricimonas virosa TaxID=544645 RepID=UPI00241C51CE|nr:restriction endonuclease subunit S [Butyricimonas virosa]